MANLKIQSFDFQPWNVIVVKNHILKSNCSCKDDDDIIKSIGDRNANGSAGYLLDNVCMFCRYNRVLKLPQLPEMTFADNALKIVHQNLKFGLEFNCLDALKLVDDSKESIKVPVADAWRQSRKECENMKEAMKPFDWTFTTDYQGSLIQHNGVSLKEEDTDENIDYEKLKRREEILFYETVHLYEDELADNGCAVATARIRVMKSGFFVLLRFFLRVDDLMIAINDTRIYYEVEKSYFLKEYTSRSSLISNLKVKPKLLCDPDELLPHLNVNARVTKKLSFPLQV